MLPGETKPVKELLFFCLNGIVVLFHAFFYDIVLSRRYRRLCNPILVILWFYLTEPLLYGDMMAGGLWVGLVP
jgi:hypothetical protein